MAIDAISPVMSAAPLTTLSRPPETAPRAQESAAQENDARRIAESVSGASPAAQGRPEEASGPTSAGTRVQVVASPDNEGSLRESQLQLARSSSESTAAARSASDAYQAQAAAMQSLAQQQRGNGTQAGSGSQGVNILA